MYHDIPELEDLGSVAGKHVLVRCDLDVPMKDGVIVDDFRIRACLPTLQWLRDSGAIVTVIGHLGRPKGQIVPSLSMDPIRDSIEQYIDGIVVKENVRFDGREETNDDSYVQELIAGQDFFVNEVFGVSHRKHASVVGPPRYLPSAAGRNVINELRALLPLLTEPKVPFFAFLGGAKVSDKIGVVRAMLKKADRVLIGGAMANTFLAAQGHNLGESLAEYDQLDVARELLADPGLVLPSDLLVESDGKVVATGLDLEPNMKAYDIGPRTSLSYSEHIEFANTVFWNGPMGLFEDERFASGTMAVAVAMARGTHAGVNTIVGGGDSAAAAGHFGLIDEMSHVSTGGGASLELIEFGDLPGLQALRGEHVE